MGDVTRLIDVVAAIETLDRDATIYAARPWTAESAAAVAMEPESGGLPGAAAGMVYFLEVSIARDVLASDLIGSSAGERTSRLIHYALLDA